uniref:NADH-ubiquinone oxidoreductase chain 2 n=1 Tax=Nocticola sp. JW1 9/1 TaxID=2093475 RepID=A0A2P1H9H6_9NEOP|nr:NADH dehydrogenase subunit 2 [Nocticola sp. JW1 9/1]
MIIWSMLLLSILLISSSTSWLSAWIGLEINLMMFIPIMLMKKNNLSTESSMKYFLIQAMGSSSLLFMVIMIQLNSMNSIFPLLAIPLALKMGLAPLHWWLPSIMEGLDWISCLTLLTIQKIAPTILINHITVISKILIFLIISSSIIGSIGGLNQISLRKILAYSSINHSSWFILSIMLSHSLWFMYFLIYSIMLLTLMMCSLMWKMSLMNQIPYSMKHNPNKLIMSLSILSLGGLPPLLGFLPKWMVMTTALWANLNILILTLTMLTMLTLFFYLKMIYWSMILNMNITSWSNLLNNQSNFLNPLLFLMINSCLTIFITMMSFYT